MYILCIVLIIIASILIILAVLAQNPKSGMAANFGASNQVMGVRQTADFLEKATWGLAIAILVLSLVATLAMPKQTSGETKTNVEKAITEEPATDQGAQIPNQVALPAEGASNQTATPNETPAPEKK